MSDMYAIKGSTLTAIGDAIRNKTGIQEELREISYEVDAVFNHNLASFNPYKIRLWEIIPAIDMTLDIDVGEYNYTLEVPNATSIKAKVWVYVNRIDGPTTNCNLNLGYGDSYTNLVDSMNIVGGGTQIVQEYDLSNTNKLNFKVNVKIFNPSLPPMINYTAHIEVYGFDAEGNPVKGEKEIVYANDMVKNTYTPLQMAETIDGLMTVPDEAFNVSGNCQYRFAYDGSNWLIDNYGDKITTNNISNANQMFHYSDTLKEIPFEINMAKDGSIEQMFSNCQRLLHSPIVNYPELTKHIKFGNVFSGCYRLREVPEWLVDLLERDYNLPVKNTTFGPWDGLFEYCRAIRKIPDRAMKSIRNDNMTGNYYGVCYSKPFSTMSCLDELVGVHCDNYNYTSNQFSGFFSNLDRVKNITFATNDDGTPVVRPWKSQTIDLSGYIGSCANGTYDIFEYTTITADKQVKDDATYQALKNDPDYFTTNYLYSRYNHDSAVNTINSLPDCSATGTNTIKFRGQAGALTDGGAINTLTEAEIAVAAAKGWTVSLV